MKKVDTTVVIRAMRKIVLAVMLCGCNVFLLFSNTNELWLSLHDNWMFKQAGSKEPWQEAVVPGTIHQDLLRHRKIPDPFYGNNQALVQWVENEDWEYKTTFTLSASQLQRDGAQLVLEGLDTYADVYLNGALILRSDNMFVGRKLSVKHLLKEGENRLHIYFHSPIKQTLPQYNSNGFNYPADNDHHEKHLSVFSRKAPYSYGWDWGIRLVTCGIWRPIRLRLFELATINDYHIRQLELTQSHVTVNHDLSLESLSPRDTVVLVNLDIRLGDSIVASDRRQVVLPPSSHTVSIPTTISNPQYWMPNGWGEATLYVCNVQITSLQGDILTRKSQKTGFRNIRFVQEKDADGESFYFEVNGIPLFAKGANYIPQDALLPNVGEEQYRQLFQGIKDANMNMIRVWGGGVYEDDLFYQLADEFGILIWQDFMFACTPYPADPQFLQRVAEEADYNIRRLRNHPSLALWCGNNEVEEALKYWGIEKKYSTDIYEQMLQGYERLFKQLLPSKVKELDVGRAYIHTSPYFANWGRPHTWSVGDSHNWGVWYGRKPFESLDEEIPRFMSEFGFQSFPEMKTIASFASPEDYHIESDIMNAHQKSSIGNDLIRKYMSDYFVVPSHFEDFIYVGLVLQGQGIRRGIEAHRRNKPYCMGSLYWQLNDSWPVVSWSGIDYYGNRKALHYQAKRAFSPIIISVMEKNRKLSVHAVSDKLENINHATLELQIISFQGEKGKKIVKHNQMVKANSSVCIWNGSVDTLISEDKRDTHLLQIKLKEHSGKVIARYSYFFEKTKKLQLPDPQITIIQEQEDGLCTLELTSNYIAKDVFVEVPIQGASLSDNFFDLLPNERYKIIIKSPQIKKAEKLNVNIKHIKQTLP